jgi:hypothetical protein
MALPPFGRAGGAGPAAGRRTSSAEDGNEPDHAVHRRLRRVGQLITFRETPGVNHLAPSVIGQDTVQLMRWLGYDDETIVSYRERGIVEFPGDLFG